MTSTKRGQNRSETLPPGPGMVQVRATLGAGGVEASAWGRLGNLDGFPSAWVVDYPLAADASESLHALREAADHALIVRAETIGTVAMARSAGCSWQSIADALGVSKSSAMERYAKYVGGLL